MSPGIDSKESIPPGWESFLGLLKRFTNISSVVVPFVFSMLYSTYAMLTLMKSKCSYATSNIADIIELEYA
jgi:hypothetical protein